MRWTYPNYNSPHQCPKCLGIAYVRQDGTIRSFKGKKTVFKCFDCCLKWRYKPKNGKSTSIFDFE